MEPLPARTKKLINYGIVGSCVLAWAVAFKFGWASSEWTGLWSSGITSWGRNLKTADKIVETTEERDKRLAKQRRQQSEMNEKLKELRRDYLGDNRGVRGDTPVDSPHIPRDVSKFTQRDVCFQQKLQNPERFGDVDCMDEKYDDSQPWFLAPRR